MLPGRCFAFPRSKKSLKSLIPSLNEILFLFTSLFGIPSGFTAEEVELVINLESQQVQLSYFDVRGQGEANDQAAIAWQKFVESPSFHEYFADLELLSKEIEIRVDQVIVHLSFSYTDPAKLFALLRFNLDLEGNPSTEKGISYYLLPEERLLLSNALDEGESHDRRLVWNVDTPEIMLTLGHQKAAHPINYSLIEYWED